MNSPFAAILNQVGHRIRSEVPTVAYIDQDMGQIDYYASGTRPAVNFPCVLIDLADFEFENRGDNTQDATGKVVIRLAFAPYSASTLGTPDSYRQKALGFYDIEAQIHKALSDFAPGDQFGVLVRESAVTEKREDPIRVRLITYSVSFEDFSAQPEYTYYGGDYNADYSDDYGGGRLGAQIQGEIEQ